MIKDEPPWGVLPPDLPDPLRRLLRRCLEKDPRRRLSSIGDARLELDEPAVPASASAGPTPPRARSNAGWIVAAIMTIVAAGTAIWAVWFGGSAAAPLMRVTVQAPREHRLLPRSCQHRDLAGRDQGCVRHGRVGQRCDAVGARVGSTRCGRYRGLGRCAAAVLVAGLRHGGLLRRGPSQGREPGRRPSQILADAPDGRGASWGSNGDIVFAAANAGPILRVSANGGAVTTATELRTADGETGHRFPWFLPDGTHFLFAAVPSKSNQFAIYSAAVGSTARELVLTAETAPLYADPGT